MIWTEEENQDRELENMLNYNGQTCKTCNWSGYNFGDTFITCGYHHHNFSSKSYCSYWTDPNDPKLLEYQEKRNAELKRKLKSQTK